MRIESATDASDSQLQALRGLATELAPSAPTLTRERLEEIVASDSCRLLIAYGSGDEPIGMLLLAWYPIVTGRRFWIEDVVVAERARRQGAGEALVRAAIDIARAEGADTIDLTSRPSREAAHRLYVRLGFQRRETSVYRVDLRALATSRGEQKR